MLSFHNLLVWASLGGFMMIALSVFFPWRNAVSMSVALRFHLFDAIRVIAKCTLSLAQIGDSILKFSSSSNPLVHSLAFVEHFPSTSFCLRTQRTDIVGWSLFSISSSTFSDLQLSSSFSLVFKVLWLTWVTYTWLTKISSVELASHPFSLICRSLNNFDRWSIL